MFSTALNDLKLFHKNSNILLFQETTVCNYHALCIMFNTYIMEYIVSDKCPIFVDIILLFTTLVSQ